DALGYPMLNMSQGGWEIANLSLRAPTSRGAAISLFGHHPLDCFVTRGRQVGRHFGPPLFTP
ncbi:MAG: hypothetical protein KAS54_03775, partial [Dehalococcoidia bacterium]|nr:hypothetical protein [Dehalococcoidia bacterium]